MISGLICWHPVEECLPKTKDDVLVTVRKGKVLSIEIDSYNPTNKEWRENISSVIVAWSKLPRPYPYRNTSNPNLEYAGSIT